MTDNRGDEGIMDILDELNLPFNRFDSIMCSTDENMRRQSRTHH